MGRKGFLSWVWGEINEIFIQTPGGCVTGTASPINHQHLHLIQQINAFISTAVRTKKNKKQRKVLRIWTLKKKVSERKNCINNWINNDVNIMSTVEFQLLRWFLSCLSQTCSSVRFTNKDNHVFIVVVNKHCHYCNGVMNKTWWNHAGSAVSLIWYHFTVWGIYWSLTLAEMNRINCYVIKNNVIMINTW